MAEGKEKNKNRKPDRKEKTDLISRESKKKAKEGVLTDVEKKIVQEVKERASKAKESLKKKQETKHDLMKELEKKYVSKEKTAIATVPIEGEIITSSPEDKIIDAEVIGGEKKPEKAEALTVPKETQEEFVIKEEAMEEVDDVEASLEEAEPANVSEPRNDLPLKIEEKDWWQEYKNGVKERWKNRHKEFGGELNTFTIAGFAASGLIKGIWRTLKLEASYLASKLLPDGNLFKDVKDSYKYVRGKKEDKK